MFPMMGFTKKEYTAIFFIAKKNGFILRLCQKPWVYFKTKDHKKIAMRITDILDEYESLRKEEARNSKWNPAPTLSGQSQ
jgi:hypothetical protein